MRRFNGRQEERSVYEIKDTLLSPRICTKGAGRKKVGAGSVGWVSKTTEVAITSCESKHRICRILVDNFLIIKTNR